MFWKFFLKLRFIDNFLKYTYKFLTILYFRAIQDYYKDDCF